MKKCLSILMVMLLVLAMIPMTASAEQTVVQFWTHQNTAWNESYEVIIEKFQAENPDIVIEYTNFPYGEFEAKIQTALIAGDAGADVYEAWGGWMLDFSTAGALSEMPEQYLTELLKDAFEPVMGMLQYDGKYYGAPVEFNSGYGGMLVNKHLFEDNGIAYPTTWAETLDVAKQVAVEDGAIMEMRGLEFAGGDSLLFNWIAMILQNGGTYWNEDKTQIDLANPVAVEAMQTLIDYIKVDHVTNLDTNTGAQGIAEFQFVCVDQAYMATNGPWIVADAAGSYGLELGVDFDYIPTPPFVEGAEQKWAAETGWSLCVPKATKVADAAWKFVDFILQPENLLQHNINCAQIPPRASVASDPAFLEGVAYMKPVIDILGSAQYLGSFNSDILKNHVQQMFMSLVSEDGTYESIEAACQKLNADMAEKLTIYK